MSSQSISADGVVGSGESIWTSYSTRDRTLLAIGSAVSFAIFWYVGKLFSIPQLLDYQASLLVQPSPLLAIIVAGATLVACVLIASFIAGTIHFDAGLFCASIGLLAFSTRGGPMRYVLMYNPTPGVFIRLMIETLLLGGCIVAGWVALVALRDGRLLRGEPSHADDPDPLPAQGLMALAAQVIGMIFLMLLLAATDQKAQVTWSIAISAMLSAMAAHSLFPARPSYWFWPAPLIVGVIGYAFAFAGGPAGVGGQVGGMLPALARPLPLDYASVGTAGALMGYWTSRKWQHERDHEPVAESDAG